MNTKLQDPNNLICAFRKVEVGLSPFPSLQQWEEHPLEEIEIVVSVCVSLL